MSIAIHNIQDIPLRRIDGAETTLGDYNGRVLLIVNVASKCGLTPQYEGLEALYRRYRDQGFEVLGFPANNFAGQEPGTNTDIQNFCRSAFGVEFQMFEKISVTGEETHPLYRSLIQAQPKAISNPGPSFRDQLKGYGMAINPEPGILWNFEKFLVGRSGEVVARFSPEMLPEDPAITAAVETELGSA